MRVFSLFFFLFAFISTVKSQTQIKSVESCVISKDEESKVSFETEVLNCLSAPEGFYLLKSDKELSAFYSMYSLNSKICDTYQLPKIDFDTGSLMFFKTPHWSGTQVSKQFYFAHDTLVLYLEFTYRRQNINTPLNYELGIYNIGKSYLKNPFRVFTCHKVLD